MIVGTKIMSRKTEFVVLLIMIILFSALGFNPTFPVYVNVIFILLLIIVIVRYSFVI
jgi:hypothetical protein